MRDKEHEFENPIIRTVICDGSMELTVL